MTALEAVEPDYPASPAATLIHWVARAYTVVFWGCMAAGLASVSVSFSWPVLQQQRIQVGLNCGAVAAAVALVGSFTALRLDVSARELLVRWLAIGVVAGVLAVIPVALAFTGATTPGDVDPWMTLALLVGTGVAIPEAVAVGLLGYLGLAWLRDLRVS